MNCDYLIDPFRLNCYFIADVMSNLMCSLTKEIKCVNLGENVAKIGLALV